MQVDANDMISATHEMYLRIVKELVHEVSVLQAQLSALRRERDAE